MKLTHVLLLLFKVVAVVVFVTLITMVADHLKAEKQHKEKMWKYEEVYYINETYDNFLLLLGIDEVYYHDWEETANSLDIPVDSLTVNMFLKHLLHHEDVTPCL